MRVHAWPWWCIGSLVTAGLLWGIARAAVSPDLPPPGSREWLRIQNELAIRAARQGYWQEALYRWMQIARYRSDWAGIWNNLAIAMEATGRPERALTFYRRALAMDPNNVVFRANYMRFRQLQQKYGTDRSTSSKPSTHTSSTKENEHDRIRVLSDHRMPARSRP